MEVTYIDHMGSDLRVCQSARVSFSKETDWEYFNYAGERIEFPQPWEADNYPSKKLSEQDQKLIKYLAKHKHDTPFQHVVITMREKVPIFVARQVFRSTVGISRNEVSRRYVDDAPEFFQPIWRERPEGSIKQGSGEQLSFEQISYADLIYGEAVKKCEETYNNLLSAGVAPEQARMVLPQSMMTEFYTTASLSAWARMYKLRSDPHAQVEIQELASKWDQVISGISELEYSWTALKK